MYIYIYIPLLVPIEPVGNLLLIPRQKHPLGPAAFRAGPRHPTKPGSFALQRHEENDGHVPAGFFFLERWSDDGIPKISQHNKPLEGTNRMFHQQFEYEGILSFWGWKGKFGVSSQGMWAKSLNVGSPRWLNKCAGVKKLQKHWW